MEKLLTNFDKTISLGSNCYIKRFLNENISQETNFFDWLGTSMWAINELVENEFKNIFEYSDFGYMKTMNVGPVQYSVTNQKYYLRFPHDLKKNDITNMRSYFRRPSTQGFMRLKKFLSVRDSYTRRANRFNQLLKTQQKILFIRFEENLRGRIMYNAYQKGFSITELESIVAFSKLIKQKYPDLQFEIIFVSRTNENNYDKENNILVLKDNVDMSWNNCATELKILFDINMDFILNSISQ